MLHTKYRLDSLDKFIGSATNIVIDSVKSCITKRDRPHSYLLTGERGTGKTTLARIMAKEIGCNDLDIIEINGSDNRGIDDIRGIIESVVYNPINGENKAYIIDEAHALTNDASNCLLKVLEEPPNSVYFFLCTTNPNKLIATIKSRCTKFKLELLNEDELRKLLFRVSKSEGVTIGRAVLEEIVKLANGSPRDALTLLESVISLDDDEKRLSVILGNNQENKEVIELCRAIANQLSFSTVMSILDNIEVDPEGIRRAILGYLTAVLKSTGKEVVYRQSLCFVNNFFDDGKAKLIMAIYEAVRC